MNDIEILESEDGDRFWADGHIDPALMVAAVAAHLRANGAFFDTTDLQGVTVENVAHVWFQDDGTDNEYWPRCEPDALGATAVTELSPS